MTTLSPTAQMRATRSAVREGGSVRLHRRGELRPTAYGRAKAVLGRSCPNAQRGLQYCDRFA
jgi:hypothetical protein